MVPCLLGHHRFLHTFSGAKIRPALNPADTDVFKMFSGRLKEVTTSYKQTRRCQDVWKKSSNLRRLKDVLFTLPWRRLIYNVLRTSDLRLLKDVRFTSSGRRPIYDVFKTSVKRRLGSKVLVTSIQRQKKWFFLISYCLEYSENSNCSCLGYYLGRKFCKLLRFFNPSWSRSLSMDWFLYDRYLCHERVINHT